MPLAICASPLAIADTNIVVAGLLTSRDDSPVARVLDGMLAATFPFAVSEALLAEYGTVLRRPSLRAAHGLTPAEIDIILVQLAQHGVVLAPCLHRPRRSRAANIYGNRSLRARNWC